jgi:hypothetical protein
LKGEEINSSVTAELVTTIQKNSVSSSGRKREKKPAERAAGFRMKNPSPYLTFNGKSVAVTPLEERTLMVLPASGTALDFPSNTQEPPG